MLKILIVLALTCLIFSFTVNINQNLKDNNLNINADEDSSYNNENTTNNNNNNNIINSYDLVNDDNLDSNEIVITSEIDKNEIIKKLEKIQLKLKGEYCSKNDDCLTDSNLVCLNNKCKCQNDYKYSKKIKKCIECPNNWIFYEDKCYFIVKERNSSISWNEAQNYCSQNDSDLISVESEIFFEFWVSFSDYYDLKNESFYIGLKYEKNESTWRWLATNNNISPTLSQWKCLSNENVYAIYSLNYTQSECSLVNEKYTIESIECNKAGKTSNFICQKSKGFKDLKVDSMESLNKSKTGCSNQSGCLECPNSWIMYNQKCYYISSIKLTWNIALDYCASNSSVLISIDSESKYPKELFNVITKNVKSVQTFWIGGYKNSTKGEFVRLDGENAIYSNSWWKSQHHLDCISDLNLTKSEISEIFSNSSEFLLEEHNCLSASTSILISSRRCNTKLRFICEKADLKHYPKLNDLIVNHENDVCSTEACKKFANLLFENMNTSIDPCESFYEFNCGKFLNKTIPNDLPLLSTFENVMNVTRKKLISVISKPVTNKDDFVNKNVKILFSSCMNLTKINETSEIFLKQSLSENLGGWSLLNNYENNLTLLELLIRLNKYSIIDNNQNSFYEYLFSLQVQRDESDSGKKILQLKQPQFLIPKDYLNKSSLKISFKTYLETVLVYLNHTNENYLNDIEDIFEIYKQFSMIQQTPEQIRDVFHKRMNISSLQSVFPKFPWSDFIINGIFRNLNVSINSSEPVLIYDWEYFVKFANLFHDYSINQTKALKNYLIYVLFHFSWSQYLPEKYSKAQLSFTQVFHGIESLGNREIKCITFINNKIPFAIGKVYVENFFDKKSKTKVVNYLDKIKSEFFEILNNETKWMDEVSKRQVASKLHSMKSYIAYHEPMLNSTYMKNLHDFNLTDNFFENGLIISKSSFEKYFGLLRFRLESDLIAGPANVDAYYYPNANKIYLPAAFLQFPFFDFDLPDYLNYASLGFAIGHEITHAVDDLGRLYDKDGNFNGKDLLWSEITVNNFKNKSMCMIKQYDSYVIKQVNKSVIGSQTLGENLADNGGFKASYKAYIKSINQNGHYQRLPGIKYSQEQLFFISAAQAWCTKYTDESLISSILTGYHTPSEARINILMSNMPDFSNAFRCKSGKKIYQAEKCSVW